MMNDIFEFKSNMTAYIPSGDYDRENFMIEFLDICSAYLEPIKYDISRFDVIDYIENNKNLSFYDFLLQKKYITEKHSFKDVCMKYSNKDMVYKIHFKDISYEKLIYFLDSNRIEDLISSKESKETFYYNVSIIQKEDME